MPYVQFSFLYAAAAFAMGGSSVVQAASPLWNDAPRWESSKEEKLKPTTWGNGGRRIPPCEGTANRFSFECYLRQPTISVKPVVKPQAALSRSGEPPAASAADKINQDLRKLFAR